MNTIIANVGARVSLAEFKSQVATEGLPRVLYLVYRRNEDNGKYRLIYIGDSTAEFVNQFETSPLYKELLAWAYDAPDILAYSVVKVDDSMYEVACNAMIYALQPALNSSGKESFDYDDVMVIFNGRDVCRRSFIRVSGS